MKVRKYGHEPAQTSSQAKRIGNKPTLFLELFCSSEQIGESRSTGYRHHFSRSRLVVPLSMIVDFPGLDSLLASLVGMELAVKRLNKFSGRRVAFA
jgi:hypothetical protein